MQKWEYMTQKDIGDKLLATLGDEGWELVSVVPISSEGWTTGRLYYFKRQK